MPQLDHQHEQHRVLDAVDDAIGADSDAMKVLRTHKPPRSDRAWFVGERRDVWRKPPPDLGVELSKRAIRGRSELDSVGRHGLEPELSLDVTPRHAVLAGLKERQPRISHVGLIFVALKQGVEQTKVVH